MDRMAMHHRLKVHVHIEANMETALIEVRGMLTVANIRALYVIARRTGALLPGREIVIDLTRARAVPDAITALHDPAQLTELTGQGKSTKPCRLRIVDPPPVSLTHSHGVHPHDPHSRPVRPRSTKSKEHA